MSTEREAFEAAFSKIWGKPPVKWEGDFVYSTYEWLLWQAARRTPSTLSSAGTPQDPLRSVEQAAGSASGGTEREQFEAWANREGIDIQPGLHDRYMHGITRDMWSAWQARGALLFPPAGDAVYQFRSKGDDEDPPGAWQDTEEEGFFAFEMANDFDTRVLYAAAPAAPAQSTAPIEPFNTGDADLDDLLSATVSVSSHAIVNHDQAMDWLQSMEKVVDRLAASTLVASTWQPIETAPEDGVFLVFLEGEHFHSRTHVASWHPNLKIIGGAFEFDVPKVTHWRRLPDSPLPTPGIAP